MNMKVIVYGKVGCAECDKMKAWLDKRSIAYEFLDMQNPGDDWREKGFAGAMALSAWFNGALPIVRLGDGRYATALDAKRRIEREIRVSQKT